MTLLQIMNEMCHVQKDFFIHHGELKHLTLEMVAEKCGLAISILFYQRNVYSLRNFYQK